MDMGEYKDLSGNELKVFLTLKDEAGGAGHIELTMDQLEDKVTTMCEMTLRRMIKLLVAKGYIEKEWLGGPNITTYYILK